MFSFFKKLWTKKMNATGHEEPATIDVLLTGAGFTKNFGAPLASEITASMLNDDRIQNNEKLKELLLRTKSGKGMQTDYEEFYQNVVIDKKSTFSNNDKEIVKEVLLDIFIKQVDYYCRKNGWPPEYNQHFDLELDKLFIALCHSKNNSIFFTLNQDLFIERQLYKVFEYNDPDNSNMKSVLPNIKPDFAGKFRYLKRLNLPDDNIKMHYGLYSNEYNIRIDTLPELNLKTVNLSDYCYYIKLHGSMDLIDTSNNPLMITGKQKDDLIKEYSLLNSIPSIIPPRQSRN